MYLLPFWIKAPEQVLGKGDQKESFRAWRGRSSFSPFHFFRMLSSPSASIRAFYSLATLAASSTHLIGAKEFKGETTAGKGYKMDERAPGNSRKSISVPAAHDIFLILERGKFTTIKKLRRVYVVYYNFFCTKNWKSCFQRFLPVYVQTVAHKTVQVNRWMKKLKKLWVWEWIQRLGLIDRPHGGQFTLSNQFS